MTKLNLENLGVKVIFCLGAMDAAFYWWTTQLPDGQLLHYFPAIKSRPWPIYKQGVHVEIHYLKLA
jgi:hypothetical protein